MVFHKRIKMFHNFDYYLGIKGASTPRFKQFFCILDNFRLLFKGCIALWSSEICLRFLAGVLAVRDLVGFGFAFAGVVWGLCSLFISFLEAVTEFTQCTVQVRPHSCSHCCDTHNG